MGVSRIPLWDIHLFRDGILHLIEVKDTQVTRKDLLRRVQLIMLCILSLENFPAESVVIEFAVREQLLPPAKFRQEFKDDFEAERNSIFSTIRRSALVVNSSIQFSLKFTAVSVLPGTLPS